MISIRSLINLSKSKSKGFAAVLAAAFIPLVMYGLSYLVKYTQKSDVDTKKFEIPYIIGKNIAQSFNPGKTWDEQKNYLYSVGAQTYNAESFEINKGMNFPVSSTVKVYRSADKNKKTVIAIATADSLIESLYDFYKNYSTKGRNLSKSKFIDNGLLVNYLPFSEFIYDEQNKSMKYFEHSKNPGGGQELIYAVNNYKENEGKLKISLNENGNISVVCNKINRKAQVQIPRNNVDIVIAIPTNRASNTTSNSNSASFGTYTNKATADSTPIRQIARACQAFLKPFLHTAGVSVGIVPYSGKITLSPYSNYNDYTTQISMKNSPLSLSYAVQAMFYASDGKGGGDIIMHGSDNAVASAYGDYKNWGSSTIGLPIMARRGQLLTYRNMNLNTGNNGRTGKESLLLDMKTKPTVGNDYKFMRMNTNPCYLGFCNTLAMTCEKDCPTYMANPYFMTELTSDIQGLIYDLELFVPFKDERNKSNFLFLPLVMAGNMFSWGSHPSELSKTGRITEPARETKARAVIIIANAPDNFEPRELTYLGFNNDYSEIPMIESDTILFNKDRGYAVENGKYKGVKGAVQFSSNSGRLDTSKGYIFNGNSSARISFPNKGVLKIVTERDDAATIQVHNDNGVVDNVGNPITFIGAKTLNFRGPQQVNNYYDQGMKFQQEYYTTKGPNFGHNLSTKKVKIKFSECKLKKATLSNQILRFYGTYYPETNSLIENTSGSVWPDAPTNMKKRMDPCINSSENYNDSTNGWLLSSGSSIGGYSSYYISAYGFKPTCYGITRLNRFIAAAGNFPTDGSLIPDNAKIKYGNNWQTIGNIKYDTSSGIKYRCYTDVNNYPSSNNENYIQISTGQFKINSYYYWKLFDYQKYRTRKIDQSIDTIRTFYSSNSSSSSSQCCAQVFGKREVPYTYTGTCYEDYTDTCYEDYTDTCYESYVGTCTSDGHWSYGGSALRTYFSGSGTKSATCWSEVGSDGVVGQCYDACPDSSTYCELCDSVVGGGTKRYYSCRIGTGSSRTQWEYVARWVPGTSYSCTKQRPYSCTKQRSYSCTKRRSYSCSKVGYRTENYVAGYNEDITCGGVFWKHHISSVPSGWSLYSSYKNVSCDTYTPTTNYRATYRLSESQYGSCSYLEGATGNSICSYPFTSTSIVAGYGYAQYFGCSRSGTSCSSSRTGGSMNITVNPWNESTTMQKRFYGFYKRNPDGSTKSPTFQICDTNGNNCSSTSYRGSTSLSSTGTRDDSKTETSPFRYDLYNFFFVSGDGNKTSTYSYSGNDLTSKISSEADSNLINNKGIYLLPVSGEENTYWVCFCGDGDLQLDFEDLYDAYSVTFSNINTSNERISLDNSGEISEATGILKNTINARQTFYILPEQIKDILDAEGNYYIDMKMTGHTKIISVELTNRPLKSFPDARQDPNATIKILGSDSSGGKLTGDNDVIEVKTNRKISFSVKAEPVYFWIDGQSDFRQTSGTARICGNSNKSSVTIHASVPNSGSGKITLESGQISSTRKTSVTGVSINEVTPNYNYTITSDRKLSSINVPSFVTPKVSLSGGGVSSKSYTFCARETGNNANQKLFDWASGSMSHSSGSNYSGFGQNTFYGTTKKLHFSLTACELKSSNIYDMSMKFSPNINDFPSVDVISHYTSSDPIFRDSTYGYYIDHRTICCYGLYFKFPSAYNTYGSGTIVGTAYKNSGASGLTLIVGGSSKSTSSTGNCSLSGVCHKSGDAVADLSENGGKGGRWNYLTSVEYKIDSYNLMNKVVYSSQNTTSHNYEGYIPFHGVGNIRLYVQPKKVKTSNYSRAMSESEISGTFGNYKYNFSEMDRLLNLDNEELTSSKGSFSLLYSNGKIGSTTISLGSSGTYSIKPSTSSNGYYYSDVNVSNVVLGLSSSLVYAVGTQYLSAPQQGVHSIEEITISPSVYEYEQRNDGYFYVKIPCRNVYVSSVQFISTSTIKAFAHPNIIAENLINTRIIDGYDQATNKNMKQYGNINYNNSSLPSVSAVQRLFYNLKANNNTVYLYPRKSGSGSALTGEEGDFFIQLWDHDDEVPAVRWKIGSSINSSTTDIDVAGSGFGSFKSNYAFNGLHRMFFPYDVYNKNYAGYSYALNSALVFAGYTLPINLILTSNGYQLTNSLVSGNVSSYTKPNDALSNLAKDACSKLQTDLKAAIFLIKYRTNAALSLESCVNKNQQYTINNESDLTEIMKTIALVIKESSKEKELAINVQDIK